MQNIIMLGNGCNFQCSYCFEHHKHGNEKVKYEYVEMYLNKVYSDANPFGLELDEHQQLHFLGGEPLLYMDVIEKATDLFLELIHKKGFNNFIVSIATNGYDIDNPRVQEYLHKHKDYLRIEFSIDGNKRSHDTNRRTKTGAETYNKIWENFQNTDTRQKALRWCLTSNNVSSYAEVIKEWLSKGYMFDTHFDNNDSDYPLYGAELFAEQAMKLAKWYMQQPVEWIINHKYFFECSRYKPQFLQAMSNEVICIRRCTLDVDGMITKCIYGTKLFGERLPEHTYGYIYEDVNWADAAKLRYSGDMPIELRDSQCFRCPIGSYCGRCTVSNYSQTGDKYKFNKNVCGIRVLRHLEQVFYTNFWIRTYEDNAERLGIDLGKKISKTGKAIYGEPIKDENFEVMDLMVPECWALEYISQDAYDYLVDLTLSVGGNINPLPYKFYTEEDVKLMTNYLREQQEKYNFKKHQSAFMEKEARLYEKNKRGN